MPEPLSIGLIGLGRMGQAMVQRLRAQGQDRLTVWDRDAARVQQAAALGATAGEDPADVAQRSDAVLSIINDDAGALRLFDGARGLFDVPIVGKLFIEMSTLRPATVQGLARSAQARGAQLVAAPVMGSIPTVREGKLLVLAGGDGDAVARAEKVLAPLARRVVHLGPAGAGNAMKLAVNLSMGAYLQALSEGLALGLARGLDLAQMLEVLGEAPTANGWLQAKLPVLQGGAGDTTLDIVSLRKDIMSAVATGAADGVAMPLASGLLAALSAAVATGGGGLDLAQLPRLFREQMLQHEA
jgi:3-hydroxyisobutyrate dehydrogenase-like beta-hydroxyacid dehydrogenase